MKIMRLLFLTILTISIISCSKDDDSGSSDLSGDLTGTWTATDFEYESNTRVEGQGTTIESNATGVAKELDVVIEFQDDPRSYQVDADYILEITTEVSGETIVQEVPIVYSGSGTWDQDGDILRVTVDGEENEATLLELTENTMRYISTSTQTQTQSGVTTTVEITETSTFTKQ